MTIRGGDGMRKHDQSAPRLARKCRDGMLHFIAIMHVRGGQLHSQRWRGRLGRMPECNLYLCFSMHQHHGPDDAGRDLFEQFDPLSAHGRLESVNPVMLPPGRAMLATQPLSTGAAT